MMRPFLRLALFLTLTSTCTSTMRMPKPSPPGSDDPPGMADAGPPATQNPPADAAAAAAPTDAAADARFPGSPDPLPAATRMKWWHEAKFGMFIHWGLYSALAGSWNGQRVRGGGEWIMTYAQIPVQDYAHVADTFAPTMFDAERWVQIAKDAGMKYIVITAKHHEGFAMYPSKVSPFNLTDATSWKRDPLRELAAAARRQGIKFGVYYSHAMDWHHPGGSTPHGVWDPAQLGNMDDYLRDISVAQVRELLTNYPDLAVLWWDMPVGMTPARGAPLDALLRLQPQIITNSRLGHGFPGDYDVAEQNIPAGSVRRAFETCMTMNGTWGYRADDNNWKTTATLVRNLVDSVSKGGNFLLNVGPTAAGEIPAASVDRLAEMGRWLQANGESVYAASASGLAATDWGRITVKRARVYLHVFDRPASGTIVVPMTNAARRVYPLGAPGTVLHSRVTAMGLEVDLSPLVSVPPDPLPLVLVVEIAEAAPVPTPVAPDGGALDAHADGSR
jgi:alpha-L-fucosidase